MANPALIDIGSAVRELLSAVPTIIDGIRKSYESALNIKDNVKARSDIRHLEQISEQFGKLIFEPEGIRDELKKYVASNGARPMARNLGLALNRSHTIYNDALKSLNLSTAFKARHPELMAQLNEYSKQKSRIITGIGDRITWHKDEAQLAKLRDLYPLFDKVNRGIADIQKEIKTVLLELDRHAGPQENASRRPRAATNMNE